MSKNRTFFHGYLVLNRDLDPRALAEMVRVLEWSSRNMATPHMLHYILEIEDEDIFDTNRFIQRFKEKFVSLMRERNRLHNKKPECKRKRTKLPKLQLIYSIEMKNKAMPGDEVFIPYLHLHLMVIVDTDNRRYSFDEVNIQAIRALSRINGLESLWFNEKTRKFYKDNKLVSRGFLKWRDKKSTIKASEEFPNLKWHDLKTELEDAICRASYLCKRDQKKYLPEKFNRGNSFGHTRPPREIA